MDGKASATVLGCRPSVIKWVGKDLTSDINSNTNDCDSSTLGARTMSSQENKQSKYSDESPGDQQAIVNNDNDEVLLPKSNNAIKTKYDCLVCNQSFKWRSHWKSHLRVHNGERPFQCEICGKTFTRSDGLQCHKKVHLKITKTCSSTNQLHFALEDNTAQVETDTKHNNVFICEHCGRTFVSRVGCRRHTDQKHKGLKYISPIISKHTVITAS